ncbi:unnamed protein product [Arctogadus glacialis]
MDDLTCAQQHQNTTGSEVSSIRTPLGLSLLAYGCSAPTPQSTREGAHSDGAFYSRRTDGGCERALRVSSGPRWGLTLTLEGEGPDGLDTVAIGVRLPLLWGPGLSSCRATPHWL